MALDLQEMSKKDLEQLRKDVDVALKDYDTRKKAEARAAAEAAVRELGFSLQDVVEGGKGKGKKGSSQAAPKYRNPNDPTQTWSGRGRRPAWILEHVENGGNLEDFAI